MFCNVVCISAKCGYPINFWLFESTSWLRASPINKEKKKPNEVI